MNQFPFDGDREIQDHEKPCLQTYHAVIFNSYYSLGYWETFAHDWKKHLLANRLNVPQRLVLYPPVQQFPSSPPNAEGHRPVNILMMGRFFLGRQSKRQEDALRVFSQLKHRLLAEQYKWTNLPRPQLFLVGGQQPGHEDFTKKLVKHAEEIGDVHVVTDATPSQVYHIMANATVVWSMTGFGAEEDDPADAEHFGIAVTEAMSAGAYPILLNRGGLPEIVCEDTQAIFHGNCTPVVGALASSDEDFVSYTMEVLLDENDQASKWRIASKSRASRFSSAMFVKAFTNMVHKGSYLQFWTRLQNIMHDKQEMMVLPREVTPYVAVIVEMRIDVVLPTVIRNQMAMLGCMWRLHVFHGKRSEAWLHASLSDLKHVEYTLLEQNDLNDSSYNHLLKQAWFWKRLGDGTEYALVFQLDGIMLKPAIVQFLDYDYIGAPWTKDNDIYKGINEANVKILALKPSQRVGNGGFSLRKVRAMLHAIAVYGEQTTDDEQEDVFFVRWLPVLGYTVAPLHAAASFALEVPVDDTHMPAGGPMALHQSWLYTDQKRMDLYWEMLKERHASGMTMNRSMCKMDRIGGKRRSRRNRSNDNQTNMMK
jgi:glycosyltransferase involved in cell wall biosynthesis